MLHGSCTPPGTVAGGHRRYSHVYECCACSTFPSTSSRFGFARRIPLRTLGCEPSPASSRTSVHHRDGNDSHSGASQFHLPCEGFHTRGAVASPSMCHGSYTCITPHSNRSPLESEVPAPARACSVPSPPMPARAEEVVMIPTRSVPHPPCGRGCAGSLGEPGRAPITVPHHSPPRPHSVLLSHLGWDTRSGSLGYVPLMGCASPSSSCPLGQRGDNGSYETCPCLMVSFTRSLPSRTHPLRRRSRGRFRSSCERSPSLPPPSSTLPPSRSTRRL